MLKSPLGRTAKDVKNCVIGVPFKVADDLIGTVIDAWEHHGELIVKVRFKLEQPGQLLTVPGESIREFKLKPEAWDRVFDMRLRVKELKNAIFANQ